MAAIRFYFDFLSPYSYLAWKNLNSLGINLDLRPVPMGRLIHHYETKGPAEITPKRNYLLKDCLRKAQERGVEFNSPIRLPMNTLPLLRYVCAAPDSCKMKLTGHLFNATWVDGVDIEDEAELTEYLSNFGMKLEILSEKSTTPEVRKMIKQFTKDALNEGVFGVPTMITNDDEFFWGDDSIPYLQKYLNTQDSYNVSTYRACLNTFEGAVRH